MIPRNEIFNETSFKNEVVIKVRISKWNDGRVFISVETRFNREIHKSELNALGKNELFFLFSKLKNVHSLVWFCEKKSVQLFPEFTHQ